MGNIIKFEIVVVVFLFILGLAWAFYPERNIEPFFAVTSLILICIEIFRRIKNTKKSETVGVNDSFNDLVNRFPKIIDEMKQDVANPENSHIRKFFVKSSKTIVNSSGSCFEYHTDKHNDIEAAIAFMCDLNFIEDITPSNCPMYRFKEDFYLKLKNT